MNNKILKYIINKALEEYKTKGLVDLDSLSKEYNLLIAYTNLLMEQKGSHQFLDKFYISMDSNFDVHMNSLVEDVTYNYSSGEWSHKGMTPTLYLGTLQKIRSQFPQPEDTLYIYQP